MVEAGGLGHRERSLVPMEAQEAEMSVPGLAPTSTAGTECRGAERGAPGSKWGPAAEWASWDGWGQGTGEKGDTEMSPPHR